eukprot:g9767.t1
MNSKTVIRIEEVKLARSHKYCDSNDCFHAIEKGVKWCVSCRGFLDAFAKQKEENENERNKRKLDEADLQRQMQNLKLKHNRNNEDARNINAEAQSVITDSKKKIEELQTQLKQLSEQVDTNVKALIEKNKSVQTLTETNRVQAVQVETLEEDNAQQQVKNIDAQVAIAAIKSLVLEYLKLFAEWAMTHLFKPNYGEMLLKKGILVIDDFLSHEEVLICRHELQRLDFAPTRQPKTIRTDNITWIHENQNFNSVNNDDKSFLPELVRKIKAIGCMFENVLGKLEAPNNGYRAHLDCSPPKDDDLYWLWKSSRETSERKLTSILYLNDEWTEQDGGKLRCYIGCERGDSNGQTAKETIDIEPKAGRLVLFLSKKIPHEVLPITSSNNSTPRMAMSCWFIQSEDNEIS